MLSTGKTRVFVHSVNFSTPIPGTTGRLTYLGFRYLGVSFDRKIFSSHDTVKPTNFDYYSTSKYLKAQCRRGYSFVHDQLKTTCIGTLDLVPITFSFWYQGTLNGTIVNMIQKLMMVLMSALRTYHLPH